MYHCKLALKKVSVSLFPTNGLLENIVTGCVPLKSLDHPRSLAKMFKFGC